MPQRLIPKRPIEWIGLGLLALIGVVLVLLYAKVNATANDVKDQAEANAVSVEIVCRDFRNLVIDDATEEHARLLPTLKLLKIKPTPTVIEFANDQFEKKLERYDPDGCEKLPSAKTTTTTKTTTRGATP